MLKTMREEALEIIKAHREMDPSTTEVWLFPTEVEAEKIKLLEVSPTVPTSGDFVPFNFPPSPKDGIERPVSLILLSQEEWNDIKSGKAPLPSGWDMNKAEAM